MANIDQICSLLKLLKTTMTKKTHTQTTGFYQESQQYFNTQCSHIIFSFLDEDLSTKYFVFSLQLSLPNLAAKQATERVKANAQREGPPPPYSFTLTFRWLRLQLLPTCRNQQGLQVQPSYVVLSSSRKRQQDTKFLMDLGHELPAGTYKCINASV